MGISPTLKKGLHISVILIKIGITTKVDLIYPPLLEWLKSSSGRIFLALIVGRGVLRGKTTNALVVNSTKGGMRKFYFDSILTPQQGANVKG